MKKATASTLIEVLRFCASKISPTGALPANPIIGVRGRMRLLLGLVALVSGGALAGAQPVGCAPNSANYPCVYVANANDGTVSVINAITNQVIATDTVTVGTFPEGLAVTPNNSFAYVANSGDGTVSVINSATNTVVATIQMQNFPFQIAITPDGAHAYVTEFEGDPAPMREHRGAGAHVPRRVKPLVTGAVLVEVIATATNTVVGSITVPNVNDPTSVVIGPNGALAYVSDTCSTAPNSFNKCVQVFDTGDNPQYVTTVQIPGTSGFDDGSIAITPDGSLVCVSVLIPGDEGTSLGFALINTGKNTLVTILNTQANDINPYAFAMTGSGLLYAGTFFGEGGEVYLINPSSEVVSPIFPNTSIAFTGAGLAPDGASVYLTNAGDDGAGNTVTVVNTKTNSATSTITVGDNPQGVAAMQVLPIPSINQPLVPDATPAGGAAFTLTVNGTLFTANSVVNWNGAPLATTYVSHHQLTAAVPASNILTATTASVTVTNPAPGGGTSNVVPFTVTSPTASLTFASSTITVGLDPGNVVVADFNNDGKADLAVFNQNQTGECYDGTGVGTISILLGNGDGTFSNTSTLCFSQGPSLAGPQLVAGDFNGDGKTDLVASLNLDELWEFQAFLGNGDGTFTASGLFGGFNSVGTVIAGDFNGDGKLDLAFPASLNDSQNIFVALGNGDGTFTLSTGYANLSGTSLTTGDFNNDGILDLAVIGTGDQPVTILLGNGDGTFTAATSQPLVVVTTPQSVTAGDFNGDGILDLAIADASSGILVLLQGAGDGTFLQVEGEPVSPNDSYYVAAADFNGDNKLDLAFANFAGPCDTTCPPANTVTLFLGNGNGTFPAGLSETVGNGPVAVGVGDFTGDGRLDVAVANSASNTVTILLQAPVAALSPSTLTFSSQLVGSSATQSVTLTNSGSAPLTITSIGFTGTNASEFTQNSTCGSSLAGGSSCTIDVTFTPTAGGSGSATASLSVTDSAASSPQTVAITGTVQSFSLTTTCVSLTVVPGQTAIFTVDLAPVNGFTQSVALSCSGAPALATCTASPNPVALNGSAPVSVQVTATTTQATGFLQPPFGNSNGNRMAGLVGLAGIAGFGALVVVPGKRRVKAARRLYGLIFLLCLLATLATLPSCGGGGVDPPGTAAGTYTLTVTGTFQPPDGTAITEMVSFNLVVQ
jgi:YVTN family beta-propeller protein